MEEKELASLLQQYVLVSNNLRFKTEQGEVMWDEINRLFSTTPLADFDEVTLRDYVYTANNPEYAGNYHTINSKFKDDFNFSEEYLGNVLVYQDRHGDLSEEEYENIYGDKTSNPITSLYKIGVQPGDYAFGKGIMGGFSPSKDQLNIFEQYKIDQKDYILTDIPSDYYSIVNRTEENFGRISNKDAESAFNYMPFDYRRILNHEVKSFESLLYDNTISYNNYQIASEKVTGYLASELRVVEKQQERLELLGPERVAFEDYIMADPSMTVKDEPYNGYHFHGNEEKSIKLLNNWANKKEYKDNPYFGFTFEHGYWIGPDDLTAIGFGGVTWRNKSDDWIIATAPLRYDATLGVWKGGEQQIFEVDLDGEEGVKEFKRLQEWMLDPIDTYNVLNAVEQAYAAGIAQQEMHVSADEIFEIESKEAAENMSDAQYQDLINKIV